MLHSLWCGQFTRSANYKTKNNTTVICAVPSTVQINSSKASNSRMPDNSKTSFEQLEMIHVRQIPPLPVYDTVEDSPILSSSNAVFSVTTNQAYGCCNNHITTDNLEEYEEMSHATIPSIGNTRPIIHCIIKLNNIIVYIIHVLANTRHKIFTALYGKTR